MTNPTLKTAGNRRDWLLIVLCLFTVTFFVYRDFEVRMLYGYAVLAMILGLHVLCRLWQNRAPGMDPLRMALLLLAAAVLVNFLRPDSRHNSDTISFIISMVICCGFVILSRPSERMGRLALGLCFAGAVALTGYIFFFENNPWYFWNWFMPKVSKTAAAYTSYYVPKGYSFTLGGCTQTDYTLFLGLAACGGYVTSGRKFDWKSAVASLFGIFFLYSILIVGRRGELLGAAACLAILVLALCGKKQRRFLIIGGIIAGVVGFGAVVVLIPWLKQIPALHRYVWTVEWMLKGYDVTSGRTELYALAWSAFLHNPLFGLGWDMFYSVIPDTFQALHGQNLVEDVHNIYLQFLCETGIVGTPFLVVPLFYIYWLSCRQLSRLKGCSSELQTARMFCTFSFMIQTFLLVMGLIDPTFQKIVFWCFYGIALLLQCAALELEGHTSDDPVSRLLNKLICLCAPPLDLMWSWAAKLLSRLRRNSAEKK